MSLKNQLEKSLKKIPLNSSQVQFIAETLVEYELARVGIIICTPSADMNGTDRILLLELEDKAKIGRVQIKGRSLNENTPKSNIVIPASYVQGTFCVFMLILTSTSFEAENSLYCFFAEDIEKWKKNKNNEFFLNFTKNNFAKKFKPYIFESRKIEKIKDMLIASNPRNEFYSLRQTITSGSAIVIPSADDRGEPVPNTNNQVFYLNYLSGFGAKVNPTTGTMHVIPIPSNPNAFNFNSNTDTFSVKVE